MKKLILLLSLFLLSCGQTTTSSDRIYDWQDRENICLDYPVLNQGIEISDLVNEIGAMLCWIDEHIQKVPDHEEYWQTSCETIERGAGDCEDLAILLWSFLKDIGISANSNRIAIVCNTNTCHQVVTIYAEITYLIDVSNIGIQRIYTIESFFIRYPQYKLMTEYNLYSTWSY